MVFIRRDDYIETCMTRCRKLIICCFFGSVLATCAVELEEPSEEGTPKPQLPGNPYQAIADRNVFGLKPVPPPPQAETPKPPPPNIILSGITTLQGRKTAFLKTPAAPGKPGQQSKGDQYFMLSEGEMDRDMKVLNIDESSGVVKVAFAGSEMALNFTDNGAKPTAAPPPPGQPGQAPGQAQPGVARPAGPAPGTARPISLPTRVPRTQGSGGIPAPVTGALQGGVGQNFVQVNTGNQTANLSLGGVSRPNPVAESRSEVHQLPPEQQFVLQELEREKTAELVNRQMLPPLPPTPLTTPGAPGSIMPAVPGQEVPVQMPH